MKGGQRAAGSGQGEQETPARRPPHAARYELIVIGCSAGGLHALQKIFCALPAGFKTPVAVVQHRHKTSSDALPEFFRRECKLRIEDALDKQRIAPGTIYLAPPDYHLLVAKGQFELSVDDPVRFSRPSIDVLFESAADAYGQSLIAVVLTGANQDGANGARRIKARGGFVVAQNPGTAEYPVMPQAAIDAGAVDQILPLEEIAPFLVERCQLALYAHER